MNVNNRCTAKVEKNQASRDIKYLINFYRPNHEKYVLILVHILCSYKLAKLYRAYHLQKVSTLTTLYL